MIYTVASKTPQRKLFKNRKSPAATKVKASHSLTKEHN